MQAFTEAMLRDIWADNSPPQAVILTIDEEALAAPMRFTNWPGLLDDPTVRGIESGGETYLYAPFALSFQGAGPGDPARDARIEIGNAGGEVALAVRTATSRPTLEVGAVRVDDPDVVELAMSGAILADVEISGPSATATIKPREFNSEPACQARHTVARTPGLF